MYRLKLFGSAGIEGPAGPVTGHAVQRRRIALLALLSLARQRGVARDKLIGYLWPDSNVERARHLLSDSVYRINREVGGDALVAVGDELRLNPARLRSDAWEFIEAIEREDWQRAVELHVAPFLDGFFLTDADELEHWVDAQRERFARSETRALEALAEGAEASGDLGEAVHWWRALSARDRFSSRIALRLMRALERTGDRAAALKHGRAHAVLLEEEMGVAPDEELLAFIAELQVARPTVAAAPGVAPSPPDRVDPRSVAVLPFIDLGADPENDFFVDGMTEDVIARLSKISALTVISRRSVMQFRNRQSSLREIGDALGVANLLDGSVRRVGGRVRIVVQLIDARRDHCLWSETYDRQLTDVFAIQSDVALHIATALHAVLTAAEKARVGVRRPPDFQAYQLYLQGRHSLARYDMVSVRQSLAHFERALVVDPRFARACASLALALAELGETGGIEPVEAFRRAAEAAARALDLDDELAEAHCASALVKAVSEYDWSGAEAEYRRALELSPSSADTWDLYGRMCAALERYEEALAMTKRAWELDPLAHRADFATTLLRAGRYAEALEVATQAVELEPALARGRATLGWALLKCGRGAEGVRELEEAVALSPESTAWLGQLGQACAITGDTARARDVLHQLEERSRGHYVSPYHMAYVVTGLGDSDRAIDLLERAIEERAGGAYGLKGAFLFASLRSHPRFPSLLARLNLT